MLQVKKYLVGTGYVLGGVVHFIIGGIGLLIHLWTILIALATKGILAAVITLVFPFVSQFYWGYYSWNMTGTFFNTYCVVVVVYAILSLFMKIIFSAIAPKVLGEVD